MSHTGNIPPVPGTSNNLGSHKAGEVGCQIRKHLRPCQSQVKITALLQQTESVRHIKHNLLTETEAVQFVSCSNPPQIYSKYSTCPKLCDRRVRRLTFLERSSESLLRLQSDLSSPILVWSNVNQVLTSYVLLDLMIV